MTFKEVVVLYVTMRGNSDLPLIHLDLDLDLDLERVPGRDVGIQRRLRMTASRGRLSTYGSCRFPVTWSPCSPCQESASIPSVVLSSNVRRRSVVSPSRSSLSRRLSSRRRAAASQSAGKLRLDADSGGLDRASASSSVLDDRDGGVGEPARRGKLMLPGMRCSNGTVGDGRTRGMLMMLFLRREWRGWDRFSAVGGLRTGSAGTAGITASTVGTCTGGASSTLGVDDSMGEAPAVGDVVARGIDGARRTRLRGRPVSQHHAASE